MYGDYNYIHYYKLSLFSPVIEYISAKFEEIPFRRCGDITFTRTDLTPENIIQYCDQSSKEKY